ncbi:MAG: biopolymer transporter ExbD [Sulfuriferula sp.]|nr:biopolymer transporter ExbD [Sulfuriferula sp.]
MSFGSFDNSADTRPMAEINMIPLIDVMLVLLIVFMVTAPLLTHAVKLDLPKAASQPQQARPDDIHLSIRADGSLYWNDIAIEPAALQQRMAQAASTDATTQLQIYADRQVPYGRVAEIMAMSSRAGLNRIGFVSEPTQTSTNPLPATHSTTENNHA